jgi:hypothetical protein
MSAFDVTIGGFHVEITNGVLKTDDILTDICADIITKAELDGIDLQIIFGTWKASDKHQHALSHILVQRNYPKTLRLVHSFADINAQRITDQCTPLHLSAWGKKNELIELLIELGADPSISNKYGETVQVIIS